MTKKGILFLFFACVTVIGIAQIRFQPSMGGEISWRCLANGQFLR